MWTPAPFFDPSCVTRMWCQEFGDSEFLVNTLSPLSGQWLTRCVDTRPPSRRTSQPRWAAPSSIFEATANRSLTVGRTHTLTENGPSPSGTGPPGTSTQVLPSQSRALPTLPGPHLALPRTVPLTVATDVATAAPVVSSSGTRSSSPAPASFL